MMLAVKLHKRKKPNLEKGSFLIPVLSWASGKTVVKRWINMLDYHNRLHRNNRIRYITLVKIPDKHPVFLAEDFADKMCGAVRFQPFSLISKDRKKEVADSLGWPEMILGEPLPPGSIKWTKDIRLLYRTSKKKTGEG